MSADESHSTARTATRLVGLERLLAWASAGLVVLGLLHVVVPGTATPRWVGAAVAVAAAIVLAVTLRRARDADPRG